VQVVSVHLDVASTLYRTLLTANATRERQISGLTDVLDSRPPLATVVGGDFNTWSVHEGALRHMVSRFTSVPLDASGTRGGMPADHMFLRAPESAGVRVVPGSYRVLDEPYLSDHRARTLRLAPAGGT
jgi:endonuclease/exonuclease/phosphatase family metal-dependent hydrolase